MKITWTKDQMKDSRGYPMTQALFLETVYSPYAIWTFDDEDKEYTFPETNDHEMAGKTVLLKSLRSYFLDIADPTEYQFAKQCTIGWDHWKRLTENKMIRAEVEKWREELEVALRSEGIQAIIDSTAREDGNFQAAKWLADKSWQKTGPGRPSKSEVEREKRVAERVNQGFGADIIRMKEFK